MVAVMMIMSPITGSLIGRVQIRTLILIGLLITGSGALAWLRASVDATYWTVLPAMLLVGLGNSFLFAPMTTGVMNSVPAAQVGVVGQAERGPHGHLPQAIAADQRRVDAVQRGAAHQPQRPGKQFVVRGRHHGCRVSQ